MLALREGGMDFCITHAVMGNVALPFFVATTHIPFDKHDLRWKLTGGGETKNTKSAIIKNF